MKTWFQLEDAKWVSVDVISGTVSYAVNGELKAQEDDAHRDLYGDRLIYSWFGDPDLPRNGSDWDLHKGRYYVAYLGKPVEATQIAELLQVIFYRSDSRHTTRLCGWEAEAIATWVHENGLTWDVMCVDPESFVFTVTSDQLERLQARWQDTYVEGAFDPSSRIAGHFLQNEGTTRSLDELISLVRIHSCTPRDELDLLYSFASAAQTFWASRIGRPMPSLKAILDEYDRLQSLRVYHQVSLRDVLDFEPCEEGDDDD